VARVGLATTLRTSPIELRPNEDVAVLGVVCGVFRPYFEQSPVPLMPVGDEVS